MNNIVTSNFLKAGYVPLPAWLLIGTIAGFFASGYNPVESHLSVLTLQQGMAHQLANIAALTTGLSIIIFAIGVWSASSRIFSSGAFCWIVFGISMIANGIWPMGGPMHGLYIIGIFNILAPALTLLDIRNDILRQHLHTVTVFVSLMSVLYLWLLLNGFDPAGYSGLTQRLFASVTYVWPFIFAYRYARTNS